MSYDNICKFVPPLENAPTDISPVNFVCEVSNTFTTPRIRSVYALHLVISGKGTLICDNIEYQIEKGDMFFTLPNSLYAILNAENLEYSYVSFLGLGASTLLSRIASSDKIIVFKNNEELIEFWKKALEMANPKNIDLISKSVLEYSTAMLIAYSPQYSGAEALENIEQYVREHFTEPNLTLRYLAVKFNYNEKYLSKLFYRFTGIYFNDYLTNLRINAACGLIQEGQTTIKQIAHACGFTDALYFSKVFKSKMNCSPSEFIAQKKTAN